MIAGGLEHGEHPMNCLKREVQEETGLELTYVSPSPKYFLTSARENTNPQTYIANIIYEVKLKNLDFTPSDECQELRFFSIQDMETANLFPNVQELLAYSSRNKIISSAIIHA